MTAPRSSAASPVTGVSLEQARSAWRADAEKGLRGASFEQVLVQERIPGLAVQPLYTEGDLPPADSRLHDLDRLGAGDPERRVHGAAWLNAPRIDIANPQEANRILLQELQGGADALWLVSDAASRLALDPSTTCGEQAWGDGGVALYDMAAWEELLDGVHLEMVPLVLDCGGHPLPCLAPLLAYAEKRGLDRKTLSWNLGADPYGSLAAEGFHPGGAIWQAQQLDALLHWTQAEMPQARAFCLSAEPYHLTGATLAESLGLLLANAVQLLRQAESLGHPVGKVAAQIAMRLPIGRDVFLHAAGLRALRLLWRRVLQASGVQEVPPLWIHAVTSRRTLSRRDPWTNLLRTSTQLVAAAMGGAEAITAASFDEALGKPSSLGRRAARNAVQMMAAECGMSDVIDPLAGSYWGEAATNNLAELAWEVFQEVEAEGGFGAAIGHGWVRTRLAQSWQQRSQALQDGEQVVLGVNRFAPSDETVPEQEPRIGEAELAALARWRQRKEQNELAEELMPALGKDLDMNAFLGMAEAGADVFEMNAAGRFALSDGRRPEAVEGLPQHRDAAFFEENDTEVQA